MSKMPKANYFGTLEIGGVKIDCAVLPNGTRVLSQQGFMRALGRTGKAANNASFKLPPFLTSTALKPFIENNLTASSNPIRFVMPQGGVSYGYRAELLPSICNIYLDALEAGVLRSNQMHIAERCKVLIRGLAVVGITGLVDEATGYQRDRAKDALTKILDAYIVKEHYRRWTKTFPDAFYRRMFELKRWPIDDPNSLKKPSCVGLYTNDLVYERLAPGVLDELQRLNPMDENGNRKTKHHQWLSGDIGHPKLKEHISGVLALMNAAPNWDVFMRFVDRAYPKPEGQMLLDVEDAELV